MKCSTIALLFAWALVGCGARISPTDDIGRVSDMLHFSRLYGADVIESQDTHGGFHGDGEYWAKLRLPDAIAEKLESRGQAGSNWKMLSDIGDLHLLPLDSRLPMHAKNAIYFFRDFQPEYYPSYESNDRPPHDRYSYNFVFAVYDPDTKFLYVYNLDT